MLVLHFPGSAEADVWVQWKTFWVIWWCKALVTNRMVS